MMLTNKHVVVALLIAPVLSIIAWFAVDTLLGEQPQVAQAGESYPLVAQSNCRYPSGQCDLENEDFTVRIRWVETGYSMVANHPLELVLFAVGSEDTQTAPAPMQPVNQSPGQPELEWRVEGMRLPAADERVFVVVRSGAVTFFGEAPTTFIKRVSK